MAPRVIVVGSGVIGACIGLRLSQAGADVTIVEAEAPGAGTSGTSFAWLDASHPSLSGYVELNIAGLDAWRRLGDALGDPWWLSLTGTLTWETGATAAAALHEDLARLRALGYPAHELSRRQVGELEPDLLVDPGVESVVTYPAEGYLFPRPAIAELLDLGRRFGLKLRTGDAVAGFLDGDRGRIGGVELTSGGRVEADTVVTCVGRWTPELLATVGVELPFTGPEPAPSAAVGLLVLTTPTVARLRRVVFADGLMMRPDGAGRLLLHGDEQDAEVRADTPVLPPPATADQLVELACARLRGAELARVESATIGIRSLPEDRLPIVGPARDGLYVVATHSGMTVAPALGELVAGEILDERQSDALERFRPARFERAMT
jgi:glycine/D-amino acid oxidase-like deaminating enzyme